MQALIDTVNRRRKEFVRFSKFLVVGGMGFAVDFGLFNILQLVFGFAVWTANPISFSAAVLNNYLWNRYWIYPETRRKRKREQLGTFFIVSVIGLVINTGVLLLSLPLFYTLLDGLMHLSIPNLPENAAKILATGVVLFWNFFVNRFWTFKSVDEIDTSPPAI